MNLATATKADLQAEVKRLRGALARAEAKFETREKSLVREKVRSATFSESLRKAHDREKATAEIVRVIGRSPSNPQPVFDAIAEAALRLVGEVGAVVTRVVGDTLHLAAFTSTGKA